MAALRKVQMTSSPAVIVRESSLPLRLPGSFPSQLAESNSQPGSAVSVAKCGPGATANVSCSPSRRTVMPALLVKANSVPSAGAACLAMVRVVTTGGGGGGGGGGR